MLLRLGVPVALSGITTAAVTGGAMTGWRWPWKTTVRCTSGSRALWTRINRLWTDQALTQCNVRRGNGPSGTDLDGVGKHAPQPPATNPARRLAPAFADL